MRQKTVRQILSNLGDPGPEPEQSLHASRSVDAHAQQDHHEIGIR
jgi:hypothetical protein